MVHPLIDAVPQSERHLSLFLYEHVPFPLLFVRGGQNLCVDFLYLLTDLIDLQSHSGALLERGFGSYVL